MLTFAVVYANTRSLPGLRLIGFFALRRIEIKIGLHAAGQNREISSKGPERPHGSAASIGRGPDQRAAATGGLRGLRGLTRHRETTVLQDTQPRRVAPFNPQELRRDVQEIGACEVARAFGIGELGAKSGEVIAENEPQRTFCNVACAIGGTAQRGLAAAAGIHNRQGLTTLRYAIGEFHIDNVAVRCTPPGKL